MAEKKLVELDQASGISPLGYNGSPVFERYNQISATLATLGEKFEKLLAKPMRIGNKFTWSSDYLANPQAMSKTDPMSQARYKADISQLMREISAFCDKLRREGQIEAANAIEMAVSVPSYDHIFVDGNKMVFAAWGFSTAFSPKNGSPVNVLTETIPGGPQYKENITPSADSENTGANPAGNAPQQGQPVPPPPPVGHGIASTGNTVPPPPPINNNDDKNKKPESRLPGWLWFLLGVILTLLVVLLLRTCNNDHKCSDDCGMGCKGNGCSCGSKCGDSGCGGYTGGGNGGANGGNNGGGYVDGGGNNGGGYPPHRPNDPYTPYDPENPGDPFFDEIGVVPPIDRDRIIDDPEEPGERPILDNEVNVALDKGQDVKKFIQNVEAQYPDEVKARYADTTIKLVQFQVPDGTWREWITKFKAMPEVKLAFPTSVLESGSLPQEPGFSNAKASWYFDDIQAPQAWDITMGDTSIIVAIADNCFDLQHPEISKNVVMPYNVTTGDANVHVINCEGNMHGTHVAGTAIGSINGTGVCGIAPNCKFMPIQLADENGMMTNVAILSGALFAIHHGASVINYSLGIDLGHISARDQQIFISQYGQDEAQFWNELYDFCLEENLVVVKAAGNEDILAECDPMSRTDKALIVAAYQGLDNRQSPKADFSNFGSITNISAPGVEILSSVPGNNYDFLDGTSMAAPVVTGGVALVKSKYPHLTAKELISVISKSGKALNTRPEIGPLLQLADALRMAGEGNMMQIPENVTDLSFAAGRWKSTSDLLSDNNQVVEVFFDLKEDGTGTIEYVENGSKTFKAPLKSTFENGELIIEQTSDAIASNGDSYIKCKFVARRQDNGTALCRALYDGQNTGTQFHMIKI